MTTREQQSVLGLSLTLQNGLCVCVCVCVICICKFACVGKNDFSHCDINKHRQTVLLTTHDLLLAISTGFNWQSFLYRCGKGLQVSNKKKTSVFFLFKKL